MIRPVPSQRSDEMYERHLTLNGERLNLSESQTHPEYGMVIGVSISYSPR